MKIHCRIVNVMNVVLGGLLWMVLQPAALAETFDAESAALAAVPQLQGVAIAAGGSHTVVLKSDGTVWAWGANSRGQLGDGTNGDGGNGADRSRPVQVVGLTGVAAIAAGGYHTLALKSDGTVWAWGANWSGELGDGTSGSGASRSSPVQVIGLTGVAAIAAGYGHTVALK